MRYPVILADPPWRFATRSEKGKARGPDRHYRTMTLPEIQALPVSDLGTEDGVVLLWATFPMLPEALATLSAWGYTYKSQAFTWVKTNKDGSPFMGMGYWTRQNAEVCLLGARGNPKRVSGGVHSVILERRGRHSEKPAQQYERIERLLRGPYVELFARTRRPGWASLGNELDGLDITDAISMERDRVHHNPDRNPPESPALSRTAAG